MARVESPDEHTRHRTSGPADRLDDAQPTYLEEQRTTLQDQTRVFYDSLISSIDPAAETTYEFSS